MRKIVLLCIAGFATVMIALNSGCATSNAISEKVGVQLWGENCNRCHNMPSPVNFNDVQWERIGTHMKIRATLTEEEVKKIIEFMQFTN